MHTPVLLKEVIAMCNPLPGQIYIDATANGGGHTFALWEKVRPSGMVIAIDKDYALVAALTERAKASGSNIMPVQGSYAKLAQILKARGIEKVHGILFDLGYSSYHIDESGRGFSFQKEEPLDMRYAAGENGGVTAEYAVNVLREEELADIIFRFGEERFSRRIARALAEERKKERIRTSGRLAEIVKAAIPARFQGRIHPATKTFQALRIFVNRELEELEETLPCAVDALASGGKLAVISFHSLEDRIVKHFLRAEKQEGKITVLTKKPIAPGQEEKEANPRARSAKLRVAVKL